MIKTIILDEAKVNEFIKAMEKEKRFILVDKKRYNHTNGFEQAIDFVNEFLETTKIEPQTTKPNQSLPYEVEH